MSSDSESKSVKSKKRSASEDKKQSKKLFITNLDGESNTKDLEDELRSLIEKYGVIEQITVKKNRNSDYCFAFVDMKDNDSAVQCLKNLDQSLVGDKKIKVELQDDQKRRKDSNKGCYTCGKMGHFARECHSSRNDSYRDRRRSRSRSEEEERRHKHKRRHRSDSSDRDRSRSTKKKQKKRKDSAEKKKKKHKKRYSSDDDS